MNGEHNDDYKLGFISNAFALAGDIAQDWRTQFILSNEIAIDNDIKVKTAGFSDEEAELVGKITWALIGMTLDGRALRELVWERAEELGVEL